MAVDQLNLQKCKSEPGISSQERDTFVPAPLKGNSAHQSNSSLTEASQLLEEGIRLHKQQQYNQARMSFQKARLIFAKLENKKGVAQATCCMSLALYSLRKYGEAIKLAKTSLKLTQELGDPYTEGRIFDTIGNCYRHLGEYRQAIKYHHRSFDICEKNQDPPGQMAALNNLGLAYKALGEYQQTFEYQQKSLTIAQHLGETKTVSQILKNLGNTCYALENYALAIKYYEQLLITIEELGNYRLESQIWQNLVSACNHLGIHQKVMKYTQKHLATKTPSPPG